MKDVPGGEADMHQDAEGGRHRSLPHQDSGGPRPAFSCWDNASTFRASAIGTQKCLRGLVGLRPKHIGQRHAIKVGQNVSQFAVGGIEPSFIEELHQWQWTEGGEGGGECSPSI